MRMQNAKYNKGSRDGQTLEETLDEADADIEYRGAATPKSCWNRSWRTAADVGANRRARRPGGGWFCAAWGGRRRPRRDPGAQQRSLHRVVLCDRLGWSRHCAAQYALGGRRKRIRAERFRPENIVGGRKFRIADPRAEPPIQPGGHHLYRRRPAAGRHDRLRDAGRSWRAYRRPLGLV